MTGSNVSIYLTFDPRELKVTVKDGGDYHKRIDIVPRGPADVYWDHTELLELGSFLHESTLLRDYLPSRILYLGWVLYAGDIPTHELVAEAILYVTAAWNTYCTGQEDGKCRMVPDKKHLSDPHFVEYKMNP